MKKYLKWLILAFAVTALGVFTYFFFNPEWQGTVRTLSELPSYGSDFKDVAVTNIVYSHFPNRKALLVRANGSKAAFVELCDHFKLGFASYNNTFPDDGSVRDSRYLPKGRRVYAARGPMYAEGRTNLTLYFATDEESDMPSGVVFIHIGG